MPIVFRNSGLVRVTLKRKDGKSKGMITLPPVFNSITNSKNIGTGWGDRPLKVKSNTVKEL